MWYLDIIVKKMAIPALSTKWHFTNLNIFWPPPSLSGPDALCIYHIVTLCHTPLPLIVWRNLWMVPNLRCSCLLCNNSTFRFPFHHRRSVLENFCSQLPSLFGIHCSWTTFRKRGHNRDRSCQVANLIKKWLTEYLRNWQRCSNMLVCKFFKIFSKN